MRYRYIIPRLIIVALVWAFFAFAFDPLLRSGAVTIGQQSIGAKVDVRDFRTGLFPPVIHVDGVSLANRKKPGLNLAEFDQLTFHVAGNALTRKRFVVETGSITGLRFGSVRNDDGLLDEVPVDESESDEPGWLSEKLSDAAESWLADLETSAKEQLDPNTLETYRTGRELQGKWEQRFETYETQVSALRPRAEQIKTATETARKGDVVEQIAAWTQIATDADTLLKDANRIRAEVTAMVPEAQTDVLSLNEARLRDQELVKQKISLLSPDPRRISQSLLGPEMYRQLHEVLEWTRLIADYKKQLSGEQPEIAQRGEYIAFPLDEELPLFLIRELELSGELPLHGKITPFRARLGGITNDPVLYEKPLVFQMLAEGDVRLALNVSRDQAADIPTTTVRAELIQPPGRQWSLGDSDNVHVAVDSEGSKVTIDLALRDDQVRGQCRLAMSGAKATADGHALQSPLVASAMATTLQSIETIDATVNIGGSLLKPELSLDTNLGTQIAAGLRTAALAQAEQFQAELTARLDTELMEQRAKLTSTLNEHYQQLMAEHADIVKGVAAAQQLVANARSGNLSAQEVFRTASGSGLIKPKQTQKVEREIDRATKQLDQIDSSGTLRGLLPGLLPRR